MLCSGGELFDVVAEKQGFTEAVARSVTRGLVDALIYLHDHSIIHRDLKLENCLLLSKNNVNQVKICDFGLSLLFPQIPQHLMVQDRLVLKSDACGTDTYVSRFIHGSLLSPVICDVFPNPSC